MKLRQIGADIRDRLALALMPRLDFDSHHLRRGSDVSLPSILDDPKTRVAWVTDHRAICSVFGDTGVPGGVNPGDRRAIYHLIKMLQPRSVLEIGTHVGASTLYIGRALLPSGSLVTVDVQDVNGSGGPWLKTGLRMTPRDYVRAVGCADNVRFVQGSSLDFMRQSESQFDLIFLDGDHSAPTVYREVAASLRILGHNGVILLHDYYPNRKPLFPDGKVKNGPVRAVQHIQRANAEIDVLPLGPLPWQSKQGSNATSLALLTRRGSGEAGKPLPRG